MVINLIMKMEKYWKAFCLVSATTALGISVGLVGPFVYHDIVKSEVLKPERLACLFAGRGFGNFLGTVVSTYILAKSNQSFWTCVSLLILAASIVLIPWSTGLIILTMAITIQGFVTSVAKTCTQNLLRLYHGFSPAGGSVQKLVHMSFSFGCFLALICVIMFTNVSTYRYSYLVKSETNSNLSNLSNVGHSSLIKNIIKRSLEENVNSSSNFVNVSMTTNQTTSTLKSFNTDYLNNGSLSTSLTSIVKVYFTTPTTQKDNFGVITNETSSDNETKSLPGNSNTTDDTFNVTVSMSSYVLNDISTTPFPMKPAVVDSNNPNHHKDAADGKNIKEQLKLELQKNPLEAGPVEPPLAIPFNLTTPRIILIPDPNVTDTYLNISNITDTYLNISNVSDAYLNISNTTDDLFNLTETIMSDNLTTSYSNIFEISDKMNLSSTEIHVNEQNSTVSNSTSMDPILATTSNMTTALLLNTPSSSTSLTIANITTIIATSTTTTTKSPILVVNMSTASTSTDMIPSKTSSIVTTKSTTHESILIPSKSPIFSNSESPSTIALVSQEKLALPTTSSVMSSDDSATATNVKAQDKEMTMTQLDQLESFLKSISWDSSSPANGFYLLSLFVTIISGMLAINSGLCGKAKNCRSFPEVGYTCSEKDSLTFCNSVQVRLSVVVSHWMYNSFEVLAGGLLASYLVSVGGISLYMGVVATCLFWFGFFCGRLAFFLLSPLARLFRLTLLTTTLTLVCLVAFLCMLDISSSLPWYFFAIMISITAFFFSLINPSFQGYRENFPLLSYNLPLQDVLSSLGEALIPPLACLASFAGGNCHLVSILVGLMTICLASVVCFKFLASSIPKKASHRRKPSFTSEIWTENGEEAEVLTSSFDGNSTTKPLLP